MITSYFSKYVKVTKYQYSKVIKNNIRRMIEKFMITKGRIINKGDTLATKYKLL
jgi:hypothetical protein